MDEAIPGGIAVTIGGICALFGPPGLAYAAVALGVAGFIALNIAVIAAMDNACGNVGIQMDVPWTFAGTWLWYIC